jgi:hypothetical protein
MELPKAEGRSPEQMKEVIAPAAQTREANSACFPKLDKKNLINH